MGSRDGRRALQLDNLIGIIDRNRLQIDGWVKDVMNVEPLEEHYRSAGWKVIVCDGHDVPEVVDTLQSAKNVPVAGKPTVIICNTREGQRRQVYGEPNRLARQGSKL